MKNTQRFTRPIVIVGAILAAGVAAGAVSYAVGGSPEKAAAPSPIVVASASPSVSPTASPSPSVVASPSDTPTQAPTQAAPAPAQQDTQAAAPAPKQTKAYTSPAPAKPKAPAPQQPAPPQTSGHADGSSATITSVTYHSCTNSGGTRHVSFTVHFTDGPVSDTFDTPYPAMSTFGDGSAYYHVPGPYQNFPC